jgi:lysophospholipid acyltransferase (LPLAT)-like uncharacterized protein
MLKWIQSLYKKWLFPVRSFIVAKLSLCAMHLLASTCRFRLIGLEQFCKVAASEKCILMLWHNRLALVPIILFRYTSRTRFAALVSGSRDGDILTAIVNSYKRGTTIRVPHQTRYQALGEIIRHVEEQKHIVIITPDGPRGPQYEIKPGIVLAALETHASVVSLNWEAKRYWELKTWDRLRLPKPFTTIQVTFSAPIRLDKPTPVSLEQGKAILKESLPQE